MTESATLAHGLQGSARGYSGVLDDAHIRAVVREGLRAHAFDPDPEELARAFAEQWRLGVLLRDRLIPARLPSFAASGSWASLETAAPYLWARLPHMAALGFRQAHAIEALSDMVPDDQDAAVLAATFNAAIACLDHVVDDLGAAATVFRLLDRTVVRSMFESREASAGALAERYGSGDDPVIRLLLALVASCVEQGWALRDRRGNEAGWRRLGGLVGRMFEAEQVVSYAGSGAPGRDGRGAVPADGPHADAAALLAAVRDKSALPSVATLEIVALAVDRPADFEAVADIVDTLGGIFSLVDDLVDLLADSRAGRLTGLTSRVEAAAAMGGRRRPADADVYDVVLATAGDVMDQLARVGRLAGERARALGGSADEMSRFSRQVVAAWAGWQEELVPASAQGLARRPVVSRSLAARDEAHPPAATAAARFLLAQQRVGYPEAAHHLHFPRFASTGVAYETHPALLAQRSVVLDALLDAFEAGLDVPRAVVASEVMSILRAKHRGVRGGWSYIAEVPELPPDADDLGQVVQELCRVGGPVLASTCDEGIRFVLDAARADGAFATWILDPRGRSPADELARRYMPIMGGAGIHPEVIANLLYGLILYDRERFDGPLTRSASYLEAVQQDDGSWPSKWYEGPWYGTFRVLWVLGSLHVAQQAMARARGFLLQTQGRSGGWGANGEDPLSTALAMHALAAPGATPAPDAIRRGTDFLAGTVEADGSWASVPWIVFPTADGEESYGSRTITTAFCLKALLISRSPEA